MSIGNYCTSLDSYHGAGRGRVGIGSLIGCGSTIEPVGKAETIDGSHSVAPFISIRLARV